MSHELYIQVLSAMFLFWNGARVLTYLPTISKLLEREADVRSYSLLSWGSWALSNGTFALMLLEMSRGVTNPMFWMNLANTLMCAVVTFIIVLRRSRRLHQWVSGLYRKISRRDSTRLAVSTEAGLPDLGVRSSPGGDTRLETGYIPPAQRGRFGRVTLWAASASAIAVGVVGTGAYGVWFNHDQRGYVEAMASPQHAPEITAPATAPAPAPTTQTALSAQVPVSPASAARATAVASVEPAPPAAPVPSTAKAAPAVYAAAPQQASARPLQVNHHATQNRRPSTPQIKPNPFVRVSLFFQRLSYQQHGTASQRDRDSDSHR
ncbi:hypothetical protein P3T23_002815 [Paraburkholderia sp. GAS448]|uniref:hypothetical protein n=1 Tax=Paraburkholderia sp. GAS448 TaxID=3035136 RepID=UPI003D21F82E